MSITPKIIAVVGPTASGKTALGIALAKRFDGEVVSADSRQIYRGMDIGTGKPTLAEMAGVPHHLIDVCNPDQDYTVTNYKADAVLAIRGILSRKKLPILVGGTGLYIRAVVENLNIPKAKADPTLRAKIEKEIKNEGLDAVFRKLRERDPEAARVVDPKNPRRVVRALEVAITTGEPFTAQRTKHPPLFNTLTLGLNPSPDILRKRINERIDRMVSDGLVAEAYTLIKKYGPTAAAFSAIGYREIIAHLNGTLSLDEATAAIKMNSWHYAKRQITWFKKDKTVQWIDGEQKAIVGVEKIY